MKKVRKQTISSRDLRRLAVTADCDVATVRSEVAEPGKYDNVVRERVRKALKQWREERERENA